jgi:hypothetical protein
MRYQRTVFRAWKAYFLIQFKVKRKYQAKLTQFVRSAFVAWAGVSHTQHRLRLTTYQVRRNLGCVVWVFVACVVVRMNCSLCVSSAAFTRARLICVVQCGELTISSTLIDLNRTGRSTRA